jgi:hypothetical protein
MAIAPSVPIARMVMMPLRSSGAAFGHPCGLSIAPELHARRNGFNSPDSPLLSQKGMITLFCRCMQGFEFQPAALLAQADVASFMKGSEFQSNFNFVR